MNRSDLQSALKVAAPALAKSDAVPSLACFSFRGGRVLAANESISIDIPCDVEFEGAVAGKPLLAFLGAVKARTVDISAHDESFVLRAGRSRYEARLWGEDAIAFAFPELTSPRRIEGGEAFVEALSAVAVSMGTNTALPWQLGVTVVHAPEMLTLYASDSVTLARATVDTDSDEGDFAVVLSPDFVTRFLALAKGGLVSLHVGTEGAIAEFACGARLFGRAVATEQAGRYARVVSEQLSGLPPEFPALPAEFEDAIERALAVGGKDGIARFALDPDTFRVATKGSGGSSSDELDFETIPTDPRNPVRYVDIQPALIRRALPHVRSVWINEASVVFRGPEFLYLLGVAR